MYNSLKELYLEQLRDLYDAENRIIEALPKMASAAQHTELQEAFREHLDETKEQVNRLAEIFKRHDAIPTGETCEAMRGLVKEAEEALSRWSESAVKDAALIASAQRVEHYEMAGYGAVRTYSKILDFDDDADLLQKTLDEEVAADEKLTKLATGSLFSGGINKEAAEVT